jgi:hypothetical protein
MLASDHMERDCGDSCQTVSVHGVSAIGFFLMIGNVWMFSSCDTLHLPPPQQGNG